MCTHPGICTPKLLILSSCLSWALTLHGVHIYWLSLLQGTYSSWLRMWSTTGMPPSQCGIHWSKQISLINGRIFNEIISKCKEWFVSFLLQPPSQRFLRPCLTMPLKPHTRDSARASTWQEHALVTAVSSKLIPKILSATGAVRNIWIIL